MLFSPTCVGLRYGSNVPMLRGFSWQQRLSHFTALRLSSSDLSLEKDRICLILKPTSLNLDSNTRLTYLSASPHRSTLKYWNINQFPFDYAFRPRLRNRLTRGWITWPRKPWVFGERVSRPFFRYSCQHNHFHTVHVPSRSRFNQYGTLPYHCSKLQSIASVKYLSPVTFSAQAR